MRLCNKSGFIHIPYISGMYGNNDKIYYTYAIVYRTFKTEVYGKVTYLVYEEYPSTINFSEIKRKTI